MLDSKDIETIYLGVDYSSFPEPLLSTYRNQHLKSLGITSGSATTWYKNKLETLKGKELLWFICTSHTSLNFQEARYEKHGSASHMRICKKQYKVASKKLKV